MLLENTTRGNALKTFFTLLLTIFFYSAGHSFTQKPDFEKIKREVTNTNSPKHIDKLVSRFLNNDTSLTTDELQYLYYGYKLAKKQYNPIAFSEKIKALQSLSTTKSNYAAAVEKCKKLLQNDMFDMDFYHYKGLFEYEKNHDIAASDKNFNFYYNLCKVIKDSGSGASEENPVYIINKNHIFFIAKLLGLQPSETIVEKGKLLEVSMRKNDMGVDKLYFSFPEEVAENPIATTQEITTTITPEPVQVVSNTVVETPAASNFTGTSSFVGSSSRVSAPNHSSFVAETPTMNNTSNENSAHTVNTTSQNETHSTMQNQALLSEREKFAAERKAEREKIIAERMAEREKIIAERMAERERLVSERKQKTNTKP